MNQAVDVNAPKVLQPAGEPQPTPVSNAGRTHFMQTLKTP
jgi:hypothetical protein